MKRVIDPNESGKCALRLELGGDRFERNSRTRKGDGTRTVESGNRDRPIVPCDEGDNFVFRQSDGKHRPLAASAFFHEARAQRDDPGRFVERKDAGDAGRRDFAHAVTNDRGRLDAPRFPERRERHLHGKNAGLTDLGPLHLRRFFAATKFLEEREAGPGSKRHVTSFDRLAKDRLVLPSAHVPCPTIAAPVRS